MVLKFLSLIPNPNPNPHIRKKRLNNKGYKYKGVILPNQSSNRIWRTGVQCFGMWANNLEKFSFKKIFLNKTTGW